MAALDHIRRPSGEWRAVPTGEGWVQFWVHSPIAFSRVAYNLLTGLAPRAGFEPATLRLTATPSKKTWDSPGRFRPLLLGFLQVGGNP